MSTFLFRIEMWKGRNSGLGRILIRVLLLMTSMQVISGKRVLLLDTTKEHMLQWTTHSASWAPGWLEESYTNAQEGTNWRSYVVCDVSNENVDNWVRTKFISHGDALRLSVEMAFTMRDCKLYPYMARTCKETFTLMAYETDIDFATEELPEWFDRQKSPRNVGYKLIDRITADSGRFTGKEKTVVNVETRMIPVSKKGVYLAFRDEGACISLLAVKVYYEVCEEVVRNFAWFPETPVGPNLTSIQETIGQCVENASPPAPGVLSKYICKADGTWDLFSGGCQCNVGHRPDGTQCLACSIGFYKDNPGLGGCLPCPLNSASTNVGSSNCECEAGFYRAPIDSVSSSCTRPPSRPIDLHLIKSEDTEVAFSWKRPYDLGGRPSLWYRVDCPECPSTTRFIPAKHKFNTTTLTLTNLQPATLYTLFVYAENEINEQVETLPMYAVLDFSTSNSASNWVVSHAVSDLRVESISANRLSIVWTVTDHDQNYRFAIRLFERDSSTGTGKLIPPVIGGNKEKIVTDRMRFTFIDLKSNTEYGYQVQIINRNGDFGPWSEIRWTKTTNGENGNADSRSSDVTTGGHGHHWTSYIWALIAVALFSVTVVLAVILIRRRRNEGQNLCKGEKQPSDLEALEYRSVTASLVPPFDQSRPLEYEDPNDWHRGSTGSYGQIGSFSSSTNGCASNYQILNPITTSNSMLEHFLRELQLAYISPILYEHGCYDLTALAKLLDIGMEIGWLERKDQEKMRAGLYRLRRSSAYYGQHRPSNVNESMLI